MGKYSRKVQNRTEGPFTGIYGTNEKKTDHYLLCRPRQPVLHKGLTQLGLPSPVAQALC